MTNLEHTSIGIRALDSKNEDLLRDIAELERKLHNGRLNIDHAFRKEVVKLTRKFKLYFAEQERWLEEHQFPILELQKKSHRYFLCEVGRAAAALEARRERADELTTFLKSWLISHIRDMENGLKTEARRKGLSDRDRTPYALVPIRHMELVCFTRFLPAVR
mgnify:FL=1